MKEVPSYAKVLTLGALKTENALSGPVIVQEKIDGSLFAFGLNEDREIVFRSRGQVILSDAPDGMFKKAVDYVLSIANQVQMFEPDTYLYCEYLMKPKHNVLCYERTPTNNLVLFDATRKGQFLQRPYLHTLAELFGIDTIPELRTGEMKVDDLKSLLETPSYLGKEDVEGVVIKNYGQEIWVGSFAYPLFTKYVREAFKERHKTDWKKDHTARGGLEAFIEQFKSEARWQKAVQHLREAGELEQSPRDIGKLILEVQRDLKEEETEFIKQGLYSIFIKDLLRVATKGLPEWYKEKLLENVQA